MEQTAYTIQIKISVQFSKDTGVRLVIGRIQMITMELKELKNNLIQ